MKERIFWWILLIAGIIPFIMQFITFTYEMLISSPWTLFDWLILYTFVYWPTYIVGLILIIISIYKLRK